MYQGRCQSELISGEVLHSRPTSGGKREPVRNIGQVPKSLFKWVASVWEVGVEHEDYMCRESQIYKDHRQSEWTSIKISYGSLSSEGDQQPVEKLGRVPEL